MSESDRHRDRGQSELIGFVLSFSMIILSVGLVYTLGLGAMEDIRQQEQLNSAERTMEGLASTYENLQRGDPARASELRLSGGRLELVNDTEMEVDVDADGSTYTYTIHPRSLAYSSAGTRISYQAGAVFRRTETGGTVVQHGARIACTGQRAIVSIPTLEGPGRSISSDSSSVVKARLNSTRLLYPPDETTLLSDATEVRLEISSPDAAGWDRYLTGSGWSVSGGEYVCTADQVLVRNVIVRVRLFD